MRRIILCFSVLLGVFVFTSCSKSADKCSFDECGFRASDAEIARVQAYLSTNGITTATEHCSGLYYEVVTEGTGRWINNCATVTARYKLKLENNVVIQEATSQFSLNEVVAGWTIGIPLVKTGGKIKLYIPPSLGYANNPRQGIPANSMLIFDVELL